MRQIQESTSLLIEEATNAINKNGKISAREIKNLKLKDLGLELDSSSVEKEDEGTDPNPTTLAVELGSSSIKFIRGMGFVLLAGRLEERFEEMSNEWRESENFKRASLEALKSELESIRIDLEIEKLDLQN